LVSDYLEVVISFVLFFINVDFFYDFIFHKSEIRTVFLEVGIDLGLLKKALLKTSKIILMCSNSLARQFSYMFHAKCLLPSLDKLLPVRSCLQNFYQCRNLFDSKIDRIFEILQALFEIILFIHFYPLK